VSLLDSLYEFFRGAAGFSLIVCGISSAVAQGKTRPFRRLGLIFASSGFLFCLSALDQVLRIPTDPSNLLILAAILVLSQALLEIALYLFGDERKRGTSHRVLIAGIGWSLLIWLLPFLDYAFGWKAVERGVEDHASLGPLHLGASIAIYAWPIAIAVVAARASHFSLRDIPSRAPGIRYIVRGAFALVLILCAILAGAALDLEPLYRAGHSALELLLICWFLFSSARPDLFTRARREIHDTHVKNILLSDEEARLIGDRLARIQAKAEPLCRAGLDLRGLAAILKVPPYRLSVYFNSRLNQSFPSWLNGFRIEFVKRQFIERPGLSILDIALEAGYSTKSSFNSHFSRIVGMSPSEYRRSISATIQS
jgi:AraC-like DNA-binding protein